MKYTTLKKFRDIHSDEVYEVGAELDITAKRAKEIETNLDSSFIMRVEEKAEVKLQK